MPWGASSADRFRVSASTAAIAGPPPPINGVPVREGVEVTVMITPDRLTAIRRAARRAVRKYDLVYVTIGRENASVSSSARGARIFGFGRPIALNEISTRPAMPVR